MKKLMLIFCGLLPIWLHAQLRCTFTHYSPENGLSQNSVMDIVQDYDGVMWFATWDGLNRFDGYDFRVYKAVQGSNLKWASNRIDKLCIDKSGYIWCVTYDGNVSFFDRKKEAFNEVSVGQKETPLQVSSVVPLENGTVWLLLGQNGGVRVRNDERTGEKELAYYASSFSNEQGKQIYKVYYDSEKYEWLLTDNGLIRVDETTGEPASYFTDVHEDGSQTTKQPFYSVETTGDFICFGSANGRVWKYSRKSDLFELCKLPLEDDIIGISRLKDESVVWISRHSGILHEDAEGVGRIRYGEKEFDFSRYPAGETFTDSKDEVWIEVRKVGCICHFNPQTREFKAEQLNVESEPADRSAPWFHICEDMSGHVWVHPYGGGLSWFDRANNRLVPFYDEIGSPEWKFSNRLHAMMSDRQGNLWLGTHSNGLEKVTFFKNDFQLVKPLECNYDTNINQIRSIGTDEKGRFWLGARDGRILVYSPEMEWIGYLTRDGRVDKSGEPLKSSTVYKMLKDKEGNLWMATKGTGIIRATPTGEKYSFTFYQHSEDDIYSLSNNSVYDLAQDPSGRIWLATFGGGVNYMEKQADGSFRFINSRNHLKSYPIDRCFRARRILFDKEGRGWVATSNGLVCFNDGDGRPENIRFHLYVRENAPWSISHNDIYDMRQTSQGNLFFATFGGGLAKLSETDGNGKARFATYTIHDGLPADVLLSLSEDNEGNLWIATEKGLSKMSAKGERFENYLRQELGTELMFEEGTAFHDPQGRLLFGTNQGVLVLYPEKIHKNDFVPRIILSGLKITNKYVAPGASPILPQSLNTLSDLVLSHKENTFTVSYAALDMTFPENVRYAYKLDGFDKSWNYVGNLRSATYTNLPKGEYVFRVRSTNAAGVWTENEHRLNVTVKPSFWETPFAYLLYVLMFFAVLAGGTYLLFVFYRLKHEVSVEQQLTNLKLRFFTNISHELRTPLTLIAGPVEYVLKRGDLTKDVREQLEVVKRNTDRMLRLVNQILDFRKIQNNKMRLRVELIDLVPFMRKIMENFESIADTHHIDFEFECENSSLKLWADADKLEKIVFNLLSNAFKYTQEGKMIKVFVHEDHDAVEIGVQDQGIGISESKRKSLFMRFETLLDNNLFNSNSTGIGLSLVKELVDMHHADIRVDSREGEGSCFTIRFHKGKAHFGDEADLIVSDNISDDGGSGETPKTEIEPNDGGEQKTMLIVEDNIELRFFLRSIFAAHYRIVEASNGKEGLDKALKFVPDIIISDIMMPEKDGIAMTRELRDNLTTSHIPIILLTAKSDTDSKLAGMELGVDSYITKPFSAVYLEARVDNLLKKRQKLQQFYCERLLSVKPERQEKENEKTISDTMSAHDRKFMEKLSELMEKNMDNGELVVDDLVRELAVSRSVFFKKLKSLTGLAPVEFIREMRVKRAAQLMATEDYNITQISYMVGINDPRYFSKCFKQTYGITPTEYKEKLKKK